MCGAKRGREARLATFGNLEWAVFPKSDWKDSSVKVRFELAFVEAYRGAEREKEGSSGKESNMSRRLT